MKSREICHVSTVHPWNDNRIFEKMVLGLSARGWSVTYLAVESSEIARACHPGVRFVSLGHEPGWRGRLARNVAALRYLWRTAPGILHFHDPELMIVGWLAKLRGWQVVYDVHEDTVLAIDVKHYLPSALRLPARWAARLAEWVASRTFTVVLAEKVYQRRFPRGTPILNYPIHSTDCGAREQGASIGAAPFKLIYTGTVSEERGAELFGALLRALPDCELHVLGRCDQALLRKIAQETEDVSPRLHLRATPRGAPYGEISTAYREGGWAFGLALFPRTEHYYEKELTKFFEYMQFGIPILCSNFPVWRSLVEGNGAGVAVDPENLEVDLKKMRALLESPERWLAARAAAFRAGRRFSWETQLDRLESVYSGLTHV
jgi:glycosyltransferase involved in cell wall biosynthesis